MSGVRPVLGTAFAVLRLVVVTTNVVKMAW